MVYYIKFKVQWLFSFSSHYVQIYCPCTMQALTKLVNNIFLYFKYWKIKWDYEYNEKQTKIQHCRNISKIANEKSQSRHPYITHIYSREASDTGEFTWRFLSRDFRRKYWRDGCQRTASGICCFVASIMVICNILLKGSFLRTFGNVNV